MIEADLRHVTGQWAGPRWRLALVVASRWATHPQVKAVVWMRVSMWLWRHQFRPLAHLAKAHNIKATGAEVHPNAQIGPGLLFVHTVGVVIGHEVVAGHNLVLHQGVTLGHGGGGHGQPRCGDGVRIGAGAVVLGPIVLGDGCHVGANAVVLADVPSFTTASGVWKR